jgi:hypothetical protein
VGSTRGFVAGNWVELSDDTVDLQERPGLLVRVATVEAGTLTVNPSSVEPQATLAWEKWGPNPKVRRWDQVGTEDIALVKGAVPVLELTAGGKPAWIDLEDGIQIQFGAGGAYRTGDYWLIPARVATGTIDWPIDLPTGGSAALPPHGVKHRYAPLGFLGWDGTTAQLPKDCRCHINLVTSCPDDTPT